MRRDEIREKGLAHKALMYKTRFIWLKNPWNLTEHQTIRLGALERLNLKINRAYLLNELFRAFWAYHRAGWATRYLTRWFWWATHSRLARCATLRGWCVATKTTFSTLSECPSTTAPSKD